MLSSSHFEHPIGLAFLMQSEETINIFHFRLCSLQISSVSYGQMLKCLTEIFIMLQISSVSSGHVADMRFGVAGGSVIIADENSILLCGWVVQDCSLQCSCTLWLAQFAFSWLLRGNRFCHTIKVFDVVHWMLCCIWKAGLLFARLFLCNVLMFGQNWQFNPLEGVHNSHCTLKFLVCTSVASISNSAFGVAKVRVSLLVF